MDFEKHRPQSIDGFRRSSRPTNVNRQPVFRQNDLNALNGQPKTRHPTEARRSKVSPTNAIPQQDSGSLIGMAIPNKGFSDISDSPDRGKKGKSKRMPWSRKRKVVTTILTIVVIFLGFFGWFGSRLIGSLDKAFHGNIFSDVQALFSQSNLKESNGRINILVAGDSADDPGHAGADLTDSIMVLSINPKTHTGFMLSIPRDLWVYVPGLNSYQKINAANDVTKFSQSGYPNGGMGQLQEIVQTDLGIPIDYEALVNYQAFSGAVNAVGGITIDVNSPNPKGLYDSFTHLKLPNGEDNLSGQQALDLARARGDDPAGDISYGFPDTDFTRTMYQREMAVAILKKATTLGVVSNPLKVTSLFSSFSNNVVTDLKLKDVLNLASLTKGMNLNNLGSYTYSNSVSGNTNPLLISDDASGVDSLIPSAGIGDYAGLRGYFQELVSNNPAVKEDASIELLNGTSINGLAKNAEQSLQSKGLTNITIGDASNNYPSSVIVDNSLGKDPSTKALLEQLFPGTVETSDTASAEAKEATNFKDTFVVILGQSYANSNPVASNTASGSGTSRTGSSN